MKALQRPANRVLLNALLDGALAAAATPLARYIADPGGGLLRPLWFVAGGAITLLAAGLVFRMPQQYWRFAGIEDLLGVVGSSVLSAALFAVLLVGAGFPLPTPTFPVVHALMLIVFLGAPRVAYRLQRGRVRTAPDNSLPILLAGSGEGAALFLRALDGGHNQENFRVLGLLGRRGDQAGRRIHGRAIMGTIEQAGPVLARLHAQRRQPAYVVITEQELPGAVLSQLIAAAEAEGVPVRQLTSPTTLHAASGAPLLAPVAIEDLLNRPQVALDREAMAAMVRGRRVLVTGAGGTIGSELARQVAGLGPAELALLDNGEYALWQIDMELAERFAAVPRQVRLADIRDQVRIRGVIEALRPELIFHAAALKHVPMVEANPLEGLLTNAAGTRNVADAARAAGAVAMVLISTDKAVNPSSVMGASKRLAEMYCQSLDAAGLGAADTRFLTVRFGNVLGSTGSVVPLFRRQLEHGGPLTVTHPEMERFFMTVREAVGLVLQATALALAGAVQQGGIFVLDMGQPVRIVDLARQMIRLSGLRAVESDAPELPGHIRIRFTGLRPGEKLTEELFHGEEAPSPTGHPGLLMAPPRTADPAIVARAIDEIAAASRAGQTGAALLQLARMVPEFDHNAEGAPIRATSGG